MNAGTGRPAAQGPLTGVGVMVTRASHQAGLLCEMIENAGGRAVRLPVLEITGPTSAAGLERIINRLSAFHIAIFVSQNAVVFGHALGADLGAIKLAAIGQKTAAALEQTGNRVDIYPRLGFTTEDLLKLPEMNDVRGRRIVIFRGEGGRERLGETLRARGASVVYAEVYRRVRPRELPAALRRCLEQRAAELITVASGEALKNLDQGCAPELRSRLHETALLAGSARIAAQAHSAGFTRVDAAKDPSDEAMFERLLQWARQRASGARVTQT
ncbi:MAG: uroporphyrinogen-III synthase [Gammaproteobacteria bacterium]